MKIGRLRQQARDGGLAGARRAPEDERAERARVEQPPECAVRAEQMILTDHLVEFRRPQLVGKRSPRWNSPCAGEPLATSTTTTPCAVVSSRSISASAADRLETLAPWNGDGAEITSSSSGMSGSASSATVTATSLPLRISPSLAC